MDTEAKEHAARVDEMAGRIAATEPGPGTAATDEGDQTAGTEDRGTEDGGTEDGNRADLDLLTRPGGKTGARTGTGEGEGGDPEGTKVAAPQPAGGIVVPGGGFAPGMLEPIGTGGDSGTQNMVTVPSITGQIGWTTSQPGDGMTLGEGFTIIKPDQGPNIFTRPLLPDPTEGITVEDITLEREGFGVPGDLLGVGTGTVTDVGTMGLGGGGPSEIFTPPVDPPIGPTLPGPDLKLPDLATLAG
jgi:hypothetical protein